MTGLTCDDEISAYMHFCKHADLRDGVIMFGDVQNEFFRERFYGLSSRRRNDKKILEDISAKSIEQFKKYLALYDYM